MITVVFAAAFCFYLLCVRALADRGPLGYPGDAVEALPGADEGVRLVRGEFAGALHLLRACRFDLVEDEFVQLWVYACFVSTRTHLRTRRRCRGDTCVSLGEVWRSFVDATVCSLCSMSKVRSSVLNGRS